jgi:hypothetical protein
MQMHRLDPSTIIGGNEQERRDVEIDKLLQNGVRVINIGLSEFARDLERCNVPVVHVDWSPPPPPKNPRIADLLAKLGE